MDFQNEFYLADAMELLRPQRLDNNVFFGPLNTLTQVEFLRENNIRFFIGIGVSTERLAKICNENAMLRGSMNEVIMINFDSGVVAGQRCNSFDSESITTDFQRFNTSQLQNLISYLVNDKRSSSSHSSGNPNDDRCLTPLPEQSDISNLLYGDISHYYGSSVFSDVNVEKFKAFNDLITLFKAYDPTNKVLVFSNDGNDEDLVTLLVSSVLKANPSTKIFEALQYVKSLRAALSNIKDEKIIWCSGLLNYYECVRANELNWGRVGDQRKTLIDFQNNHQSKNRKRDESTMKSIEPVLALGTHKILVGGNSKRSRCD
ncbi:hypothetical protein Kpol_1040p2 [Vanderwaltozyma polyspora DSM 70294]|uniref:Uncharacterized protein n=1 Tax=Vanderwaltozyma polyspora (strain ATCC 22028 / DSM 70294 / BCRC 21397 / CBS 2163 / NBRC 10782 / NRRL Y-8283 / UCD 57-17) TaxID=436907 RepID=A7TPJ7_VANPO|nr:uncharacterized protein Kpol_1040p2 [Vanderwaltozyma polyspora DSM 70294]EDO15789.1 hypothetical protein Kpol_1040p2 [Vanderwaltozyma polyspora DSM 70294]